MRVGQQWRGAGKAVLAGSAAVACAAMTAVPVQLAPAGQRQADGVVARICHARFHDGHKRTRLANRLSTDIEGALDSRADTHAVRVKDPHLGIACGLSGGRQFDSASVVKVTILAALLRQAGARHRSLTSHKKSLAWRMITRSDNTAATRLWNDIGRYRLQRFLYLAKMSQTVLGPGGYWGLTKITARDETRLLWLLIRPNPVLSTPERRYGLSLMAHVIASQRFGVPAGAPAGFTVHVKNGWLPVPTATAPWYVNSIGCFTRGRESYSIVVLTHGTRARPSMAYGVTTIEDVAMLIHHDLNPGATAVPRSTPSYLRIAPDEPIPPAG
jgi:beta-lactamase class A